MNQLDVETEFLAIPFMSLQCKLFSILIYPYYSCYQVLFLLNYWWATKIFSLHLICVFELATSEVCKEKCFNSSAFSVSVKMSSSPSINRSIILEFLSFLLCSNYVSYLSISQGGFIFNISNIPFFFLHLHKHISVAFFFPSGCLHFTLEPAKLVIKVIFDFEFVWG